MGRENRENLDLVKISRYTVHEQSKNHISLIKTGLDVTQSHPLRRMRFGQYQASSAALGKREMETTISCTKCSQVAGLTQKLVETPRTSKAPSLRAAVLHAAVFCSKILRSDRNR